MLWSSHCQLQFHLDGQLNPAITALILPLLKGRESEKKMEKSSRVEIMTGKSVTNYCYVQNRVSTGRLIPIIA